MPILPFSQVCDIHIQGPEGALNYEGLESGKLKFTVPEVPNVVIYDSRQRSIDSITLATSQKIIDVTHVADDLCHPGLVTINVSIDDHNEENGKFFTVEITEADSPEDPRYLFWVATRLNDEIPFYDYLILEAFEVESAQNKVSFFSLSKRETDSEQHLPKSQPETVDASD